MATDDPGETTRIGFTLPRAVGKAVVRNRIRRRMREACRASVDGLLPCGWRIVFNPRRNAGEAPFAELCREVNRIFARCAPSSSSS